MGEFGTLGVLRLPFDSLRSLRVAQGSLRNDAVVVGAGKSQYGDSGLRQAQARLTNNATAAPYGMTNNKNNDKAKTRETGSLHSHP
jgi:hypothetical protein